MARRAKKEGTIYKKTVIRNGKEYTYWESQVTIGYDQGTRKRLRKTFTGDTQKEVKEKMQEASVAIQNQEYFEPSKATVKQWIDIWLDNYCLKLKYQTKKTYKAQCENHIKPALGAIPLSKLTTDHIQQFYSSLAREGHTVEETDPDTGKKMIKKIPLAPKSIKNIHGIFSKALNKAVELKYIKYNPATPTERPKVPKAKIYPLTNQQVADFLSALEKETYADLYKTFLFTGMRKSEALGLSWDNIDLPGRSVTIESQLIRRTVKDGGYTIDSVKADRVRTISISDYVVHTLLHRKQEQDADKAAAGSLWKDFKAPNGKSANLVFTQKDGSIISPKSAYLHYNKIAKQMDFDAKRVHDLRHTFAVLSLQNGDDYRTLQENLGHASASFTLDVYGHRTTQMQQQSASRMQNFIDSLTAKNPEK